MTIANKAEQKSHTSGLKSRIARLFDTRTGLFVLCLVFSLAMLYHRVIPLNALPFYTGSAGQDCYQLVWDLWVTNEAITAGHSPYQTSLIYHPLGAQLGRHSLATGFFGLTFPVKLLSRGNPMYPFYAYRISILLSFALILYFSYLTLRKLEFNRWAAAIPALAYAFSAFYMEHSFHLTQVAGFFIPLTALCLVRWYHQPSTARLMTAAAVASASFYFTEFVIYIFMAVAFLGLLLLVFAPERRALVEKVRRAGTTPVLASAVVCLLIAAPFLYSFFTVHTIKPAATESSYYSANLAGFIIPLAQDAPVYGQLFSRLSSGITSGMGEPFIGFPVLILVIVALIKSKRRMVWFSAVMSLLFFALSLGPTLKFLGTDTHVPLPYAWLMRVPPFDSGRTPVRFVVIGMFFLMIVAASGLAWIQRHLHESGRTRWAALVISAILVWTVAEKYSPVPRAQLFAPPPGLEKIVSGPVLNLPLLRNDGYSETLQVFHHQPIATGYLARYTPQQWQHFLELERLFNKGGATFCDGVKARGYRNIVIAPRDVVPDAPSVVPLELARCSLNVVDLRQGGLYSAQTEERPDQFPPYVFGTRVDLTSSDSEKFLWYGWGESEPEFRWSNRNKAAIVFGADEIKPATLTIKIGAFLAPGRLGEQRVNIALNGQQLATLRIKEAGPREYSVVLPVELLRKENVLAFDLPDAESPVAFHLGDDARLLAINAQWFEIDSVTPR